MATDNIVNIFIAYSRLDTEYLAELRKYLKPLERTAHINLWYDCEIKPGEVWDKKIKEQLHQADIVILLVSANSIYSDYFYDIELKDALARHNNNEAVVIPIILKNCPWRHTPLKDLQALPQNGKPINKWEDESDAYTNIFNELDKRAINIISNRQEAKRLKEEEESKRKVEKEQKKKADAKRKTEEEWQLKEVAEYKITEIKNQLKNISKEVAPMKIGAKHKGGIIFYVDNTGKHGLIAAEKDLGSYSWKEAMDKTNNLCLNGFNDWRLPTKDELDMLYRKNDIIGGFFGGYYWSSSEPKVGNSGTWSQEFQYGGQYNYDKLAQVYVRAVGAF